MAKITAMIPKFYNNGKKVENEKKAWFEDELIKINGGFTLEGEVNGCWKGDNQIYNDINYKYVTIGNDVEAIKALIIKTKGILKQEAMYVEIDYNVNIEFL